MSLKKGMASIALKVLEVPWALLKAIVWPEPKAESRKPWEIGYWYKDQNGRWHPHVYMKRRGEKPPS